MHLAYGPYELQIRSAHRFRGFVVTLNGLLLNESMNDYSDFYVFLYLSSRIDIAKKVQNIKIERMPIFNAKLTEINHIIFRKGETTCSCAQYKNIILVSTAKIINIFPSKQAIILTFHWRRKI